MVEAPKNVREQAREYIGRRGVPGDLTNNHGMRKGLLRDESTWGEIIPLDTYEEYMRKIKFDWNPQVAEAVIEASDKSLVTEYNLLIAKINAEIGAGVKNREQANRIAEIFDELKAFMDVNVYNR